LVIALKQLALVVLLLMAPLVAVPSSFDVEVTREVSPSVLAPGETAQVVVHYALSEKAYAVVITERLPEGMKLVKAKPRPDKMEDGDRVLKWVLFSSKGLDEVSISYEVKALNDTEEGIYELEGEWTAVQSEETFSDVTPPTEVRIERHQTALSIEVPEEAEVDGNITISGLLTPPIEGATINITISRPDGVEILLYAMADTNGSFSDSFAPDAAGTWSLKASWGGDYAHRGSESEVKTVAVSKLPSAVEVRVSPSELKVGETLQISGSVSPPQAAASVILSVEDPGGILVNRTLRTAEDGSFSESFTPDAAGTWSFTASWGGDAVHKGARSGTLTVTAEETSAAEGTGVVEGGSAVPKWAPILAVAIVIPLALWAYKRSRA